MLLSDAEPSTVRRSAAMPRTGRRNTSREPAPNRYTRDSRAAGVAPAQLRKSSSHATTRLRPGNRNRLSSRVTRAECLFPRDLLSRTLIRVMGSPRHHKASPPDPRGADAEASPSPPCRRRCASPGRGFLTPLPRSRVPSSQEDPRIRAEANARERIGRTGDAGRYPGRVLAQRWAAQTREAIGHRRCCRRRAPRARTRRG